ncbi:MAG: hypothetical protein IKP40_12845 [Clostridia bacterium]|nr:hypothetical protein [Clostridia bacterium]
MPTLLPLRESCFRRLCAAGLCLLLALLIPGLPPARAEASVGQIRTDDILCFGTPDEASGFDGRWLVLDPEHTSTGEEGIFLISLSLVGGSEGEPLVFREIPGVSVSFSDRGEDYASAHPGSTAYQGSDLQQWCAVFPSRYLSEAERQALLPAYKSDSAISIPGFGIPLPGAAAGTVDFDPAEDILQGDTVFPLSAEEVTNAAYGFTDSRARVALYKGTAEGYWLRSPHIPTFPLDVGFVFSFGAVMDYAVNGQSMFSVKTYARPACNLDRGRIAALEALSAEDGITFWRVSFSGGEPNIRDYDLSLPAVGYVVDVQRLISIALIAIPLALLILLALLIRAVVRAVRRGGKHAAGSHDARLEMAGEADNARRIKS